MIEGLDGKSKFTSHEPWFGPTDGNIFTQRTCTNVGIETLAATTEIFPVADIEVRLGYLNETGDAVDGAETCTEVHRAGGLLCNVDIHILVTRCGGRSIADIHGTEVVQVLQSVLACFDLHSVEFLAGCEGYFTADDLVLGDGVAGDIDLIDVGFGAFGDLIGNGHLSWRGLQNTRFYPCIGVAT